VASSGQELYCELSDTWDESICSQFVIDTVLPLLEGGQYVMNVDTLAVRLKAWLENLNDKQVVMQSDSPVLDFQFIKEIFDYHGWPKTCAKRLPELPLGTCARNSASKQGWPRTGKHTPHASTMRWWTLEVCCLHGNMPSIKEHENANLFRY
jgi:hypothetical protein